MADNGRGSSTWLPYLDLACVTAAGGLWYAFPEVGPWPLFLALTPWVVRGVLTGRPSRRTAFDLPLLFFLLTAGLGVWAAYDRPVAWAKFWTIVGGVFLFYALVNAEPLGRKRAWLLATFGAGVALYFLITHNWDTYPAKIEALTALGQALQAPLPEVAGHRLHPNVAGGILAMMMPFTALATIHAAQGLRHRRRRGQVAAWLALDLGLILLVVTAFGLLMTTSRAAWLATVGALGLAVLWQATGRLRGERASWRPWAYLGLVGLLLAGGLAVALAWPAGWAALVENLPGGGTTLGRANLMQKTPLLVGDYPIVGAGLGGFMMLYSTYALLIHVGHSVHSHNLFLNVAIEQGLPALVALAVMWALCGVAVWRGVLQPSGRRGSGQLAAAALALVVVLAHGLVDDVLYGSRAVLLLFVPLAFAVPYLRPAASRPAGRGRAWGALLPPLALILALLLLLLGRDPILSRVFSNLGAVHQSRAELEVYAWPAWPVQDEVRRAVDLSGPVADFERALELDPGNATAHRRLGMIALARGEYEAALAHLEAAYGAEPASMTTQQLYGEALIVNGRLAEGQALWAGVDDSEGQLRIRASWYGACGRCGAGGLGSTGDRGPLGGSGSLYRVPWPRDAPGRFGSAARLVRGSTEGRRQVA
jgi:putative inorganic carbon (hco3(-)) transporter